MWERASFWIVVVLVVVLGIAGLSWVGTGVKVELYRSTPAPVAVTPAPVTTPSPTADPTLEAIKALGNRIDSKFGHVEQRLNDLDGRVKQLESLSDQHPPSTSPCSTCWTEPRIIQHQ